MQCVVLKGSMSMEQRDRMIDAFTNDPDVTVFLMSLKAGGAHLHALSHCCVAQGSHWYASRSVVMHILLVARLNANGCKHRPLSCAGVALNLTAASHVFLMDPWCEHKLHRKST